jgi:hypothetical protein
LDFFLRMSVYCKYNYDLMMGFFLVCWKYKFGAQQLNKLIIVQLTEVKGRGPTSANKW